MNTLPKKKVTELLKVDSQKEMEELLQELNEDMNDSKYMKRCTMRHNRNYSSPSKLHSETSKKRLKVSPQRAKDLIPRYEDPDSDEDFVFNNEGIKFMKEIELLDQVIFF
mgnify:CR=1 FL=1